MIFVYKINKKYFNDAETTAEYNGYFFAAKHLDATDRTFMDDLLPWSPSLPEKCRKPGKNEVK